MESKQKASFTRRLWLVVSVTWAAVAAALRRWQLDIAFEGVLSLPIPYAPASLALLCLLVAGGALFALMAARQPVAGPLASGQGTRWDVCLWDEKDLVYPTAMVAAAFLALAAAPGLFIQGWTDWLSYRDSAVEMGNNGLLSMLTASAAVLAFLGLLQEAVNGYRLGKRGRGGFSAALPAATGCVWLMDSYRVHAADPVLWNYVPLLLSIIAGMAFHIECAGMSTGSAHPRRLLWTAGATVVLSSVALATGGAQGSMLLLISQVLAALAILWRLPVTLEYPPAAGDREQAEDRLEETP